MTQLGEPRDVWGRFQEAGIKLYAISYDDQEVLADFTHAHRIPFPLLADTESKVIRAYGVENTAIGAANRASGGRPVAPGTALRLSCSGGGGGRTKGWS